MGNVSSVKIFDNSLADLISNSRRKDVHWVDTYLEQIQLKTSKISTDRHRIVGFTNPLRFVSRCDCAKCNAVSSYCTSRI